MRLTALAGGLFPGHALDRSALSAKPSVAAFGLLLATVAWTLMQRYAHPPGARRAPNSPAASR